MRTYKSPVSQKPLPMQKKSSINFIKNIASGKQSKSPAYNPVDSHSPHLTYQNDKFNNPLHQQYQYSQKPIINKDTLVLILKPENNSNFGNYNQKSIKKNQKGQKVFFSYNSQSEIKHLLAFLYQQVQNNLVFFKSHNIYIDYILSLKEYRIKDFIDNLTEFKSKQKSEKNDPQLFKSEIFGKTDHFRKIDNNFQLELTYCEYSPINEKNYLKNYEIIKCVGSGGFSKVYLVRGIGGKLMAMKVINKQYILSHDKANIINNEKEILTICSDHPFITTLYNSFQTSNFLIFILEFCNGGQLFNLLRKVRRMSEINAKFYFLQALSAISYVHQKGIVYRDIKPENIIIDYEGHIRVADYGLSKIIQDTDQNRNSKTYSFCGSAEYMAPEMLLKKGHSYEIDFYCLGALLYELVIGLPPYYSRNQNQLFSNIINNHLQFPNHVQLSEKLKNFLSRMLQKQISARYKTLQQILKDPWLNDARMEDVVNKRLKPPYKTDMFGYNFDDSDFIEEEISVTQQLKQEQFLQSISLDDIKFPNFFFESKFITDFKNIITQTHQKSLFLKSNRPNNAIQIYPSINAKRQIGRGNQSIIINGKLSRQGSVQKLTRQGSLTNIQSSNIFVVPTMHNSYISDTSRKLTSNIHQRQLSPRQQRYFQNNDSQIFYNPGTQKFSSHLSGVRSLGQINTSLLNKSNESINSIRKIDISGNIYTQKQNNINYLGGAKMASSQHNSSLYSQIQQPPGTYFSVQKSRIDTGGLKILDPQNLGAKNRNYSVQKLTGTYSNSYYPTMNRSQTIVYTNQRPNLSNSVSSPLIKYGHSVSTGDLKKSYIDGFRERLMPAKVKKSYRNDKISMAMLNNSHYRQQF